MCVIYVIYGSYMSIYEYIWVIYGIYGSYMDHIWVHMGHIWIIYGSVFSGYPGSEVGPGSDDGYPGTRFRTSDPVPTTGTRFRSRTRVHSRNWVQQWPPRPLQSFFAPPLNFHLCRYRGSRCRAHHHYTSPLSPPFTSRHSSVCG